MPEKLKEFKKAARHHLPEILVGASVLVGVVVTFRLYRDVAARDKFLDACVITEIPGGLHFETPEGNFNVVEA